MPCQQNNCTCLPAVFQRTGVCFALCFKCPLYDRQRNLFIDKIVSRSPSFPNLDDVQKLKYIADLNCPPEVINQCCKFIAEIYALRERQSTANSWWSNITYVLEIIYLLVSIIWMFFVLVFWFSYLTLSSTNVVHLDIRVIFLYVRYDLYALLVKLTSVLVMPIKILNLEKSWTIFTWYRFKLLSIWASRFLHFSRIKTSATNYHAEIK